MGPRTGSRLIDLFRSTDWSTVVEARVFEHQYDEDPDQSRYATIYAELLVTVPKPTTLQLQIRPIVDEKSFLGVDVSGVSPDDPATPVSIDCLDWNEWLSMEIEQETLRRFSAAEIIAHALWEMTFCGWHRGDNVALLDHVMRRIALTNHSEAETFDAFLSHASEDKDRALEIFRYLENEGRRIWLDEFDIGLGDSIRAKIDAGLGRARFGIVLLSPAFIRKNWTQYELDGLVMRQMEGRKILLPVWHNVSKQEVMKFSPSLAALKAVSTDMHARTVAFRIIEAMDAPGARLPFQDH